MNRKVNHSFSRLKKYCESEHYKGYDPYDGLNSRFFKAIPFLPNHKLSRLAWIQFFKRSPLSFRHFVGIEKEYNPKAMGIFLMSYCKLYRIDPKDEYLEKINFFIRKINDFTSKDYSGAWWGYNFDWESRAFFQPRNTPTIVASVFIADSLLDAYEITKDEQLLKTARSTCDFILTDLNRTYDKEGNFAFSYSKMDTSVVFNASLLGSRLLARVYNYTREVHLMEESRKSVSFCCSYQNADGSWPYGTYPFHQWIDSFHSGYNIECLYDYARYTGDISFYKNQEKGLTYYLTTFFTDKGIPKYYNDSVYPIDVHAPTQLVITLCKLNRFGQNKEIIDKVLHWTIDNMQDKKGYFYYQKKKFYTNKNSYMRWSQSWMFYSLSTYMLAEFQLKSTKQNTPYENLV